MSKETEPNPNQEESGQDQDKEMDALLVSALRPSSKDALQQLLASELAAAVFAADPLQKIRHVLEGYMLLNDEQRAQVVPEEAERQELMRMYTVTNALARITETAVPYCYTRMAFIPWTFSGLSPYDYLKPFTNTWYIIDKQYFDEGVKERLSAGEEWVWRWYLAYFVEWTRSAAPLSICMETRGSFIDYTMPRVITLLRHIHEAFVSSEVWEKTISSMRGGRVKSEGGSSPLD